MATGVWSVKVLLSPQLRLLAALDFTDASAALRDLEEGKVMDIEVCCILHHHRSRQVIAGWRLPSVGCGNAEISPKSRHPRRV